MEAQLLRHWFCGAMEQSPPRRKITWWSISGPESVIVISNSAGESARLAEL